MNGERGTSSHLWITMMILSIIFLLWTLFVMTRGGNILPTAFQLAGSPQLTQDIEKRALDFMNMTMVKPLWEEIWISIFGFFIAFGLKKGMKYAWTLGLFWGIMMIVNAVIQGGYELFILGWSKVCLQTYMFLILGVIALMSSLLSRKQFS
jgi:hypothetical protein